MQRRVKGWNSFLLLKTPKSIFTTFTYIIPKCRRFWPKELRCPLLECCSFWAIRFEPRHILKENTQVFTLTIQTGNQHWPLINGNFAVHRLILRQGWNGPLNAPGPALSFDKQGSCGAAAPAPAHGDADASQPAAFPCATPHSTSVCRSVSVRQTFPDAAFPVSPFRIVHDHILEKVLWVPVGDGVSFSHSQPGGYLHILSNKFSIFNSNRTNLDIKYDEHWFVFHLLNPCTLAIFSGEEGKREKYDRIRNGW